jgi:hypothetical protein
MKTNKIKEEIEKLNIDRINLSKEGIINYGLTEKINILKAELKGYQQATADFIKKINEWNRNKGHPYPLRVSKIEIEELKQMLVEK